MTRSASILAATAAALTVATVHAIAADRPLRVFTLGLGSATAATLAGASIADAAAARRRAIR